MKLSILIVSYNVQSLLERCLRSLERIPDNWEVIVVDNDSKDGTKEYLMRVQGLGFRGQIILLNQNVGFARGNIEAYKHATGEYILLLNPDTKVLPNAIETMVKHLDEHPGVWVAGSKLLNEDGSIQRSVRGFPTLESQMLVLLKLHNYFAARIPSLKNYFLPHFDYSKNQEVGQVMGAALMTRRSVVGQIGFLDPGFKRIFEEVDFCFRAKQAGGNVVYIPEARIVHSRGSSFNQKTSPNPSFVRRGQNQTVLPLRRGDERGVSGLWRMLTKQYYFNQGMLRFFWKHKPIWQTVVLFPFLTLSLCITMMLWVLLKLNLPLVKNKEW